MRYFILFFLITMLFMTAACGAPAVDARLTYQDSDLHIEATFTVDEETLPAVLDIEAPEYDADGRMLARNAVITFAEDSILSGVSFEYAGGTVYISTESIRIPIEDADMIAGISGMISLFCISNECYHSSEKVSVDGVECEKKVYVDGDNRVEVTLDISCGLPVRIEALADGKTISADIRLIRAG